MDLSCLMQGHSIYQFFLNMDNLLSAHQCQSSCRLELGTSVLDLRGHLLCSNVSVTYEELKTRPKCNTRTNGMNYIKKIYDKIVETLTCMGPFSTSNGK